MSQSWTTFETVHVTFICSWYVTVETIQSIFKELFSQLLYFLTFYWSKMDKNKERKKKLCKKQKTFTVILWFSEPHEVVIFSDKCPWTRNQDLVFCFYSSKISTDTKGLFRQGTWMFDSAPSPHNFLFKYQVVQMWDRNSISCIMFHLSSFISERGLLLLHTWISQS